MIIWLKTKSKIMLTQEIGLTFYQIYLKGS